MTATPTARRLPDEAGVVEVYGSKFLLEWLDRDVLAAAARQWLVTPPSAVPSPVPAGERAA